MINFFDINSESKNIIHLLKNIKYYKYRYKESYYYYSNMFNKEEEIEYIQYLIDADFRELIMFLDYIDLSTKIQLFLYDNLDISELDDRDFSTIFKQRTYSDFVTLYDYVDKDTRLRLLNLDLYDIQIKDCDKVDIKYINLILGNDITNLELIYRKYYMCKNIIRHYLSDKDLIYLFENYNNLYYSNIIADIINKDNQIMFLLYFLTDFSYENVLGLVKSIDDTDTKYYNHIMDVLNCKSSDTLVSILEKTNLTINKKQEILLLKTRKGCNI